MLKRLEIHSEFIDGLRVTDAATMEVVEMVLCGVLNKRIASAINHAGGRAVGLSGKDDSLVIASRKRHSMRNVESGTMVEVDLGLVGAPHTVRTTAPHRARAESAPPLPPPLSSAERRAESVSGGPRRERIFYLAKSSLDLRGIAALFSDFGGLRRDEPSRSHREKK